MARYCWGVIGNVEDTERGYGGVALRWKFCKSSTVEGLEVACRGEDREGYRWRLRWK